MAETKRVSAYHQLKEKYDKLKEEVVTYDNFQAEIKKLKQKLMRLEQENIYLKSRKN